MGDQNSGWRARKVSAELDELLEKEEIRWRQHSRISWLRSGDRNTKYFHRTTTWRQKKNNIVKLQAANWDEITHIDAMENFTTGFFKELYTADYNVQPSLIADFIHKKINEQENEDLCAYFTKRRSVLPSLRLGQTRLLGWMAFRLGSFNITGVYGNLM